MDFQSNTFFWWAVLLGLLSAVSLPIGSLVGLRFSFSSRFVSVTAAFGAGALIPEAAHLGNPKAVGYSTLLGFLAAVSFSLLEG